MRRTRAPPVAATVPLAVLVNGDTASSGEIVTSALRDHDRPIVLGSRTFGTGVLQATVPLPAGGALKLTVASYGTAAGHAIQHRGIAPDIAVRDTGVAPGDPVLDRAVAALRGDAPAAG